MTLPTPPETELAATLRRIVDDVLVERDFHGLSPRVARDLQLAASAITHERFRILVSELAGVLEERCSTSANSDASSKQPSSTES